MNLKELASPIRIYWDVSPVPDNAAVNYQEICREIVHNKILSLQISDTASQLSPPGLTILDTLKDSFIALFFTVKSSALDSSTLGHLKGLPVRVLFIEAGSSGELEAIAEIRKLAEGKPAVGVSFMTTRENWRELPEVLSFCINNGIADLVFPMQRLTHEGECFILSASQHQELTRQISLIQRPEWLKIIIHDPFLWRVFFPAVSFPGGGCQAANTMLYISPEADIYPCPSLPVKIGNLMKESLSKLIFTDRKKELRRSLSAAPAGCGSCEKMAQCMGGCRGRTYTLKHTLDLPDPACIYRQQ